MAEQEVDVRSEVKKAIIMGDYFKAERLLQSGQAQTAFTQAELVQLQMALEQARWGRFQQYGNKAEAELLALAVKL